MIIYIITDESKSGYDAGGIFHSAHLTREDAIKSLYGYSKQDILEYFDICGYDVVNQDWLY